MNLGKLLAAGKSIIGGRGEISYRVSNRGFLPKFISPKNPFTPPIKTEPDPKTEESPVKKEVASDGTKTQKLPVFPTLRARKRIWAGKFNPLSLWRSWRPSAPLKKPHPMQAELSLDRVKVVHNDLTDVDVEVVPIKSRPGLEVEAGLERPILPPAQGGDSWSRLSAKLFGAKAA